MSIVREALAQLLAELPTPAAPTAVATEGFGSDLSCVEDLTPDMAELASADVLVVAQAALRRLTTPRGALLDDPDYGLDVQAYVHKAMTPAELRAMAGQIRLELLKDDRIEDAQVTVTPDGASRFSISIRGVTATGPFELTGKLGAEGLIADIVTREDE